MLLTLTHFLTLQEQGYKSILIKHLYVKALLPELRYELNYKIIHQFYR